MNKKTMENDTLDKDLANCEYYLNKVLKARYENSEKPPTNRQGQNSKIAKLRTCLKTRSNIKPINQLHEPKQRQVHSQSKSNLTTYRTVPNTKNQERVVHKEILNNGTTVEVTVKTKKPESICQNLKDAPTEPESSSEPINKCSHLFKEKKTRNKDPSWGQLLQALQFQELHKNCKKTNSYACTTNKPDTEYDITDIPVKTDKLPIIKTTSSKQKFNENLDNEPLTIFNPITKVNFLFKELSKTLNNNTREDIEMNRILNTIELSLNRLNSDRRYNRQIDTGPDNLNKSPQFISPLKINEFEEERPVLLQPECTNPKTITTQTSLSEILSNNIFPSEMNTATNAVVQTLQKSCEQLEGTCSEIKANCEELRQEKATLKELVTIFYLFIYF